MKPKKAQKWSGRAEKKLRNGLGEAQKAEEWSGGSRQKLGNAQKGSEPSPKKAGRRPKRLKNQSSELVWEKSWEKPKKAQKWSGKPKLLSFGPEKGKTVGNGPGKASPTKVPGRSEPGNGLEGGAPRLHQQIWWGGRVARATVLGGGPGCTSNGPWGGARLHQQKVLGLGSLPLTLKGSTALTASVGLTLPWSVQQPQLYLGCTFSALRSLAKLGRLRALKCW